MSDKVCLSIDGEVEKSLSLSPADLAGIDAAFQIPDVSKLVPKRQGRAVRLAGLLALAQPKSHATYLTLHASTDDFHASVPLAAVRDQGLLIYEVDGRPLPLSAGGPFRFYIPEHDACHSSEVDECANVKFVDRIELTRGKGQDNRPEDEKQHAQLHQHQSGA